MAQTQRLQFIIDAENKADAVLKGVGTTLEKVQTKINDFQPAFKKMATVGTVAFASLTAVASSAINTFIQDEKDMTLATGILNNTLEKMSAKGLNKIQKSLAAGADIFEEMEKQMGEVGKAAIKLGYDDEAASIAFAKLFQVTGDNVQAQKDLQLAMDLSAFSGQDLESSVSAVVKVHAGGTRILKEFGVEVKEGTSALDALAIANEKVGGTAKAQSETLAVQMRIFALNMDNIKSAVGGALLQALNPLVEKLTVLATRFAEWSEKNPELLAKIIIITGAIAGLTAGIGFLGLALPAIATGLGAISTALLFLYANPIVVVVAGLALLTMKFNELIAVTGGFSNAVIAMGDTIIKWWKDSGEWLYGKLESLLNLYNKVINKVGDAGGSVLSKLGVGRAIGGPVTAGQSYLVGENGPEMFTPNTYGKITNAKSTAGSMGTINLNITGNSFLGKEGVAEQIGDAIIKALQLRTKFSL